MKFFIQTFGCQMNENDSLLISELLSAAGYDQTDTPANADIIIVNTCCVRNSAEDRAFGYIGSLKKLYEQNRNLIIIVTGCMIQKEGSVDIFHKSYRHIAILAGTFAMSLLPHYIEEYKATGRPIVDIEERYDGNELTRQINVPNDYGWHAKININFGCNNFCTYCIVPYVRGRERSRKMQEIIEEAKHLTENGVKEIQLLGQNVNSYGKDLNDSYGFAQLLQELNTIDGLKRIRYMTSHPRDFDSELAHTIANLDKVCRHFHLPLQSGCNRILGMMNRGYTTEEYLDKINLIRSLCPDAVITTDIIVGFPDETENDFNQTLSFLETCEFDAAYTFLYSPKTGTPAAEMKDQIPEGIKKNRLQRLMALQNPISLKKNQAYIGKILPVMVEGISKNDPNTMSGRTDGNKIVIFPNKEGLVPGDIVDVHITEAKTWNLLGHLVN